MSRVNEIFLARVRANNLGDTVALLELGADARVSNDRALRWSAKRGAIANKVGIGPE